LLEVLLKAGELEGAAEGDDLADAGIAMHRGIEADGALRLCDQVGEDRAHGLEDLLGVFAGGRVALELFGLGEGEFKTLGEGFGEVVAADGKRAKPDALTFGDDQVGVLSAAVHEHGGLSDAVVIVHRVVNGQGVHLNDLDVEAEVGEVSDVTVHQLLLHGEDADFDVGRIGFLEELIAPFHIIEGEGNLLDRLEADDLGNLFGFYRRELDEAGKTLLATDTHPHDRVFGLVSLHEMGQGSLEE
jgi:hypothetical protein